MTFLLRRLLGFAVTLFIAAAVIFFLLDLLPGDPARFILGINASAEAVANLRTQLGLDAPAWQRFLGWIGGMLTGDFGVSYTQNAPVVQLIGERLWVSLPLALIAMVLSVAIGRQSFGVGPLTDKVIADQQLVADTFFSLGLLPKKIVVADAVIRPGL